MGHSLIVAVDAGHVGIEGKGTVDGQSPKLEAKQNPHTMRPFLLRLCVARMSLSARFTSSSPMNLRAFEFYLVFLSRNGQGLMQYSDEDLEGGPPIRNDDDVESSSFCPFRA